MSEIIYYKKDKQHLIKTKNDLDSEVYVNFSLDAFNHVIVNVYSTYDLSGYVQHDPNGVMKDTLKKIYTLHQMTERLSINIVTFNKNH